MSEKWLEVLQLLKVYCIDGVELDVADLVRLSGTLEMMEVLAIIPYLEAADFIEVIEIDMCCGVDYIITGLTENGHNALNG